MRHALDFETAWIILGNVTIEFHNQLIDRFPIKFIVRTQLFVFD